MTKPKALSQSYWELSAQQTYAAEIRKTLAERYADERGIPKRIIRPDYGLYGKQAPLVRDRMIVELADAVVAIWDGVSTGTGYTISYAKSRGIPIQVYIR